MTRENYRAPDYDGMMTDTRRMSVKGFQLQCYRVFVDPAPENNLVDIPITIWKEYCELHERYMELQKVLGDYASWQWRKVETFRKLSIEDILTLNLQEEAKRWRQGFAEELAAFFAEKEKQQEQAAVVEDCVRPLKRSGGS